MFTVVRFFGVGEGYKTQVKKKNYLNRKITFNKDGQSQCF